MTPTVLLTNPIDSAVTAALAQVANVRQASAADMQTLAREGLDCDVIVVRAPLPESLFYESTVLRGVVRHGAGLDMIPVPAASDNAIVVANTPNVNARSVAEYVMAQMLLLGRHLHRVDAQLRASTWHRARRLADDAVELGGKCVGIIGAGAIGTDVGAMAHHGFNMKVLGYRRSDSPLPAFMESATVNQLLSQADFVVLACPLTPQTRGMINAEKLALMKDGASLINVSRGAVINEADLLNELQSGRIQAALDVYAEQPLADDSPFKTLPNVILSSHLAGITKESMRRMSECAALQVMDILSGRLPQFLVNTEVAERALARMEALAARNIHTTAPG